jgi:hypothetical protein
MSIFNTEEIRDPVRVLREGRASQPSMEVYLASLKRRYMRDTWFGHISNLAIFVEPIDKELGREKGTPSAQAFFNGGLIAVEATRQSLSREINETMQNVVLVKDTKDPDELVRIQNIADDIIDYGDVGYTLYPALAEVVDSWEDEVSPEVIYQPFVKRGFGVVMYLAYTACEIAATEEIMQADRNGVDWDAMLASLSPPEA